jgi:hypothetical protein
VGCTSIKQRYTIDHLYASVAVAGGPSAAGVGAADAGADGQGLWKQAVGKVYSGDSEM